jgi:hypothetical protein
VRYRKDRNGHQNRRARPYSHRQMSMPKPVCPNMATATPLGSPGPRRHRSSTPVPLRWTRSQLPPESIFPRARRGRSLPQCGELTSRLPPRHRAPNRGTGRTLIPGDGAAGDQRAQNRPACLPGNGSYATPAGCPVSTTSWRYGLRRTCRLVTSRSHRPRSTWPTRPGYRSSRSRTAINGTLSLARAISDRRFWTAYSRLM